jgi:hypothetical protein
MPVRYLQSGPDLLLPYLSELVTVCSNKQYEGAETNHENSVLNYGKESN